MLALPHGLQSSDFAVRWGQSMPQADYPRAGDRQGERNEHASAMVRRHDSRGSRVSHVTSRLSGKPRWLLRWHTLAIVLAVFTYLYGLDSQHIPKNGDEYPYLNIARTTAASGRWLPLQSDLPEMRNTKPPLLFWQGIVSTEWGRRWTLWNLRWPSVVYTLLTAAMALLVAWRLS